MFSPSLTTSSLPLLLEALDRARAVRVNRPQHLLGERAELVVVGHGLGLAADADDRADVVLDDEADEALGRRPPGALARGGHPALAEERAGGLDVPAGLLERALAVHHPRARLVAELLDEARADRAAHSDSPPSDATAAGSGVSSGACSASASRPRARASPPEPARPRMPRPRSRPRVPRRLGLGLGLRGSLLLRGAGAANSAGVTFSCRPRCRPR